MPVFRKLTPAEIQSLHGIGTRKAIELEYDGYMQDFEAGDHGEAVVGADEKRTTVMGRLKAAALRREPALKLIFRRTESEQVLRFHVVPAVDRGTSDYADQFAGTVARSGRLQKKT